MDGEQDRKDALREAKQAFAFGYGDCAEVDAFCREAPAALKPVAAAFSHNIEAARLVVSIPFTLVTAAEADARFSRLAIAAQIRARGQYEQQGGDLSSGAALPDEFVRQAWATAEAEMQKLLQTDSGKDEILDSVVLTLKRVLQNRGLEVAARELLRQAVVAIWSSLEVLSSDLFTALLNAHPDLTTRILSNDVAKKHFTANLNWVAVAEHRFDLTGKVGDLLMLSAKVDDVRSILDIYRAVIDQPAQIERALKSPTLWLLFQRRHLIVHRRGMVDAHYLSKNRRFTNQRPGAADHCPPSGGALRDGADGRAGAALGCWGTALLDEADRLSPCRSRFQLSRADLIVPVGHSEVLVQMLLGRSS
jgi:hypothetical protein